MEPVHEAGPVPRRRRVHWRALQERAADRVQIIETLTAVLAAQHVRLHAGSIDGIELVVEVHLDVGRLEQLADAHARPPVVTRALVSAPRKRWTAAWSCRLTVPSARPSALAISDN